MDNFMTFVLNNVYPSGKATCHIDNKYFCSRYDKMTEYAKAYSGFQYFHENVFLEGSDYCTQGVIRTDYWTTKNNSGPPGPNRASSISSQLLLVIFLVFLI
jgi:hypothetical protein